MDDSTRAKTNLLLRLSVLGVKEKDISVIRDSLFQGAPLGAIAGAEHSRTSSPTSTKTQTGAEHSRTSSPTTTKTPTFDTQRRFEAAESDTDDELMHFFRREFSKKNNHTSRTQSESSNQNEHLDPVQLPEETIKMLDSWFDFDIFDFATADATLTGGGALVKMGELLFERHGFRQRYSIPTKTLRSFLSQLQSSYIEDLPYHNAIHAADVAQSMSHFIVNCGLSQRGDELLRFASIVASLGHDVGHPGYTNRYLIETRSPLAITYNDKSPLENMHASKLFSILWGRVDGKCDITVCLDRKTDGQRFRKLVVEMILATDNAQHEKVLEKLHNTETCDDESIFKASIHAADVGGAGKTISLAHAWADRVLKEFYRQGDAERILGLYPVLPVMDRHNTMPKGVFQEGFIKQICLPLYKTLDAVRGLDFSVQCKAFEFNARHWVGATSQPESTSLRETKSFSLMKKTSSSNRNGNQSWWSELRANSISVTEEEKHQTAGEEESEEANAAPPSTANTLRKRESSVSGRRIEGHSNGEDDIPTIMRSKSNDDSILHRNDIRNRLNLSPRAFLSDDPGEISLSSSSIGSSSAIREAVNRSRAAKLNREGEASGATLSSQAGNIKAESELQQVFKSLRESPNPRHTAFVSYSNNHVEGDRPSEAAFTTRTFSLNSSIGKSPRRSDGFLMEKSKTHDSMNYGTSASSSMRNSGSDLQRQQQQYQQSMKKAQTREDDAAVGPSAARKSRAAAEIEKQ